MIRFNGGRLVSLNNSGEIVPFWTAAVVPLKWISSLLRQQPHFNRKVPHLLVLVEASYINVLLADAQGPNMGLL